MKKIALALIFAVSSCSTVPAMANYDKDLCEWSISSDQVDVETQIRADVAHIVEITDPIRAAKVNEAIAGEGDAHKLNYVMYCDAQFDNFTISNWILGK